jgi:hypothetical protein
MRNEGSLLMSKSTEPQSPSLECSECITRLREDCPSFTSLPSSTESMEVERRRLKRANYLLDFFNFERRDRSQSTGTRSTSEFCRYCGANIPPRLGEGTCERCDPEGVKKNKENNGKKDNRSIHAEPERVGPSKGPRYRT